ncbi:hypothetical protein [Streptomyces sp. SID2888]|nr:hypothetical protein [Streptomyces sp. SID2888]MYV49077.1 hypothetical protein [Streptomyces sp. SID2888]
MRMPARLWPHGLVHPCPDAVNEAIRLLMDQPPTPQRTDQYARLLVLWREVGDENPAHAA